MTLRFKIIITKNSYNTNYMRKCSDALLADKNNSQCNDNSLIIIKIRSKNVSQ